MMQISRAATWITLYRDCMVVILSNLSRIAELARSRSIHHPFHYKGGQSKGDIRLEQQFFLLSLHRSPGQWMKNCFIKKAWILAIVRLLELNTKDG